MVNVSIPLLVRYQCLPGWNACIAKTYPQGLDAFEWSYFDRTRNQWSETPATMRRQIRQLQRSASTVRSSNSRPNRRSVS